MSGGFGFAERPLMVAGVVGVFSSLTSSAWLCYPYDNSKLFQLF
jgi:hypothetical protein